MNLVKRTTLHYQGNPQSVYEVNLWEVEEEKYQVDFTCIEFRTKYNHHTDGKKPNQPVSLAEAEKIFYRFIRDKKKRGYVDVFQTSDESMSITKPFFDDVERKRVILERLENKKPSKWKLDRAIWRAGELKIKEATPLLINLFGTGEDLRDYCIAWSLGWCGDRSTIPVLTELYENPQTPEFVSRIAFEAILKLADEGTKAALQADLITSLPLELGRLARTTSQEIFENFAINHPSYFFQVFEKIYQIDNPYIRPSILKILRTVPFQPNYFRSIRRIFKIAEYRLDGEVFAILAYRFERVIGNFNNNLLTLTPIEEDEEEEKVSQLDNRRVYDDELKKPYPIVAYSYQTQQYFRRRIWRTLKKLGENGDANYIKMAAAILLEYSDNDQPVKLRSQFSQWNNFTRDIKQYWDKYADYLTFNHILYSNSPRFFFNSKKWFPRRGCDVNAETTVREEAFPRLWEQHPQELLKLLLESQCLAVHRFAVKVLRDCEDFCAELDIDVVIQLVYSRFDITAAFGFELGLKRFELGKTNSRLILLLTNRLFQLHSRPELLSENINLVANLITNPQPNFRKFICRFIQAYELESKTAYRLAMRLIHELSRLENNQQEIITDITDLLVGKYDLISEIPIENIKNLSFFDSTRKCGGKLLLLILERLRSNPENLIEVAELLKYYWGDVDELATEIFYTKITIESFTPNVLIQICKINSGDEGKNLLNRYFLYIRDLTIENREFYISQVQELINILVSIDKYHYTYGWFIELLKEDLLLCKGTVDKNIVLKILQAQTIELQQLGVSVINTEFHDFYNILTNKEIILLANHNLNTIRKTALETLLNRVLDNQYTIHEIFLPLTNLLNSNWEDTRWISAEILSSEIDIEEFNPNLILRIIENEKGDVIQLGKTLLTRYLKSIYQKVTENQVLSIQTAKEFIQILLTPKKREDIYSYIVTELEKYLKGWINSIDKQTLIKLLQSENSSVQELGGLVLQENSYYFSQQLTTKEIIELANHDIVSIRRTAQKLFSQNLNRLRNNQQEMLEAIRILDAKWEDTRDFAYHIFTTEFDSQDFTSDVLIAICDSNHPEARKMGRDLLTRNFKEADEEEYFIKLSEHPAQDMQKFVTNYFEKYAADNPQRLRELTPYFITVLSSVNRNRTAKKRVLNFLKSESNKNREIAEIIAKIITSQSVTMAITDKSTAIEIMLKIKNKYPDIYLPIQIQPVTEERRKSLKI